MKILLLEDDIELCSSIQDELQKAGYVVDCCHDGETAMLHALNIEYCYDLAVIDRMLPIIDGMTIIKAMRRKGIAIPVIIITGMSALNDRIEGLDNGADDYLVKPFHIPELLARIRALVRRPAEIRQETCTCFSDLSFNQTEHILSCGANSLLLTARESAGNPSAHKFSSCCFHQMCLESQKNTLCHPHPSIYTISFLPLP